MPKDGADDAGSRSVSMAIGPIERCEEMVAAEMRRRRLKRPDAERIVSVDAGLSPSSITNLRKGRLNVEKLGPAIKAAWAAFLERQLRALEHELEVARATQREIDLGAAEAAILAAKDALNIN